MNNDTKSVLSDQFGGLFYFTNYTDEAFTAKWGNIAYTFPAQKESPMIIAGATPEEVQSIRKKFAKELAEREFYKSEKLKTMESSIPVGQGSSLHSARTYTDRDLMPFIQKCLEPLPRAMASVEVPQKEKDLPLRKDRKGRNVTRVLAEGESLENEGAGMVE